MHDSLAVGRKAPTRFRLVLGAAIVFALAAGAAASAGPPPFEDSIAQRVLACTGCHGRGGRAEAGGYSPRIAGKPAGYLYNQLLNFRDGRRHYELMAGLLAPLGDAYLREIADHFAALKLPYPAPVAPVESAAVRAAGERLVLHGDSARGLPACIACHGEAMIRRSPFIPGLLGLPRDYVNAQLGAWRSGKRHALAPDCMAQVAGKLRPDEIAGLSAWLAAQPVPERGAEPAAAAPALPIACGGVADPAGPSSAVPPTR